jgi:hypothetical protein
LNGAYLIEEAKKGEHRQHVVACLTRNNKQKKTVSRSDFCPIYCHCSLLHFGARDEKRRKTNKVLNRFDEGEMLKPEIEDEMMGRRK